MSELGCDSLYFGNKISENNQLKAPYVLRTDGNKKLIQAQLLPRVGQEVNVSWLADHSTGRNCHQTQLSIQGKLEGLVNVEGEGTYRVLINDQTYTYFFDSNIWQISQKDKDARLIILIDKTSKTDYNYQEKVDPIGYALELEARGLI
tara:strand:- start:56 stop:499 length:444 start_codon:yes stop_codon:yes gene_type:complete